MFALTLRRLQLLLLLMPRYKMNEIKINTGSPNIIGIVAAILLIAIVCAGILYYYRGASGKLESELDNIKELNGAIASETRQLQADITDHGNRIATVSVRIGTSKERLRDIRIDIEETGKSLDRTVEIIDECQDILETVKTQR